MPILPSPVSMHSLRPIITNRVDSDEEDDEDDKK